MATDSSDLAREDTNPDGLEMDENSINLDS